MYNLINTNIDRILDHFRDELNNHVKDYLFLVNNLKDVSTELYQKEYCKFWALDVARLSKKYLEAYFNKLQASLENCPNIERIARDLYDIPINKSGKKMLQFSFATKLLHTIRKDVPIYDSKVSAFYFFLPPLGESIENRICKFIEYYDFLTREYKRILENGLLIKSIEAFQSRFKPFPMGFGKIKIIDSIIWFFVKMMNTGEQINGKIIYE